MVSILFGDKIISATDLKNNQKRWFDIAHKTPVSITNRRGRNYVLINREQVHNMFLMKEYAEKIVKYCYELKKEEEQGNFISDVFPWAKYLSKEERMEYHDELINAFTELMNTNNWSNLDEIITSWEATAEALTNSKFMEVVSSEHPQRAYREVE